MEIKTDEHKAQVLETLLSEARMEADDLRRKLEKCEQVILSTRLIMGHELKRPTTAICGYIDLLCDDLDGTCESDVLKYARKARTECDLLSELNNLYLELLRVGAQNETVGAETVDVRSLVTQSVEHLPESLHAVSRVTFQMGDKLPAAAFNRNALMLVVMNLIENALVHSCSDEPVRVEVERVPEKRGLGNSDLLKIRVVDKGVGIPRDELENICRPFVRLRSGTSPGSGLGLTLVKSLVELGGGDVFIRSESGRGTAVHVTVPAVVGG